MTYYVYMQYMFCYIQRREIGPVEWSSAERDTLNSNRLVRIIQIPFHHLVFLILCIIASRVPRRNPSDVLKPSNQDPSAKNEVCWIRYLAGQYHRIIYIHMYQQNPSDQISLHDRIQSSTWIPRATNKVRSPLKLGHRTNQQVFSPFGRVPNYPKPSNFSQTPRSKPELDELKLMFATESQIRWAAVHQQAVASRIISYVSTKQTRRLYIRVTFYF